MASTTTSTLPDRWLDYFCIVGLDPNAKLNTDGGDDEKDGDNKAHEKKEGATYDVKKNNGSHSTKKSKTKTKTKKGSNNEDHNNNTGLNNRNKPILLDRYPKENRSDMEFPEHLSTFCFPNGYHPLKYKVRTAPPATASAPTSNTTTTNNNNKKSKQKQKVTTIRYHHNAPEPSLCTMVLTSGSGHRLYCSTLTVYEMRQPEKEKKKKKTVERAAVHQNGDNKAHEQKEGA